MKTLLKIIFSPLVAIFALAIWLCGLVLSMSAWIFGILGTLLGILGLMILLFDSMTNGVIVLIFAFLVSPVGVPMIAAWMIGQMQRLRYFVQGAIYGQKRFPTWESFLSVPVGNDFEDRKTSLVQTNEGSLL